MSLDARTSLRRMLVGNLDMGLLLVMRPNPQTFQKTSNKIVSEQLTNSGWVTTHWGNQMDVITVSGVTASKVGVPQHYKKDEFLTANSSSYLNDMTSNSGTAKHGPKQWADVDRFMLKLEQIYKLDKERVGNLADLSSAAHSSLYKGSKNIYNLLVKKQNEITEDNSKSRSDLLESIRNGTAARARSFIVYDYCIYWGYFTNFSYTESATDKPRQFNYNFTFKVVNSTTDWLSQSLISNFPEARILNFFSQIGENADYIISQTLSMDKVLKGIMI